MNKIFNICGILLMLYGVMFFALAMSIVGASAEVWSYRRYGFFVIAVYMALGIYYVISARAMKKRARKRSQFHSLVQMLILNNFRLPLLQFAMKNNIYVEEAEAYIRANPFQFSGTLTIDRSGLIIYNHRKISVTS